MSDQKDIYLDNAATTWPKPDCVYDAVSDAMRLHGANPGRGAYRMAHDADQIVRWARKDIAAFFDMSDERHVIFTSSATEALSTVIHGLIPENSRILIGPYEHNSVSRPFLTRKPSVLYTVDGDENYGWNMDDFHKKCAEGIDYAIVSQASNVTGCAAPLREISEAVHAAGGVLIVDGSQGAGILPTSLRADGIDIYCTAGHKGLLGPMGTGLLLMEETVSDQNFSNLLPLKEGGTGIHSEEPDMPTEYPYRLEAGTLNLPGIAGLAAGIRYIKEHSIEAIQSHEAKLAELAMKQLAELPGITIYGKVPADTGVFSFTVNNKASEEIGFFLNEYFNIGVRTGLHCAPVAHKTLGTLPAGTVRVSFGCFNTEDNVTKLCQAVRQIIESL